MDQNKIKEPLRRWLMRNSQSESFRQVTGLPISIASDIGLTRSENQDRAVVLRAQVSSSKAFIVGILCDGMGGMVDGGECASLAIASFVSDCIRNRNLNIKDRLFKAVNNANKDISNEYQGNGGATLSAFILDSDGGFEAINVGDSRIYLVIKNELVQISTDDTIAGQLKQDFDRFRLNTHLLQYLGMGEDIEPHLLDLPELKNISKMLLTSDGVHFIEHKTLQAILLEDKSSAELSQRLINLSKWCGGNDNASVLLLTDLALQLFSIENVQPGLIQIWDSFGDLQLIGVEKYTSPNESQFKQSVTQKENSKSNQPQNSSKVVTIKENEIEKKSPKAKQKKKPKQGKNSKMKDEKLFKKPQLRIDFDD